MMRALSTAATGMKAQEEKLNQISQDLSNMNTTAYKRGATEFQDLMYQTIEAPGGAVGQNQKPVGIQEGSGTRVAAQYKIYSQGPSKVTNNMLDLMINGDGFFQVQKPNGDIAYTRDGQFKIDSNGRIVNSNGYPLVPIVQVPQGTQGLTITNRGEVKALSATGQNTIGRLQLASFINTAGLRNISGNLVLPTAASGAPVVGSPGDAGLGSVQQGALEGSNVNPTEAIMDMITTQRTYESNARIMSVGDQMWATANNVGNR